MFLFREFVLLVVFAEGFHFVWFVDGLTGLEAFIVVFNRLLARAVIVRKGVLEGSATCHSYHVTGIR